MREKEVIAVVKHFKSDGLILMAGPYLDGFATVFEENGQWKISSHVMAPQLLMEIPFFRLRFFKEVGVEAER